MTVARAGTASVVVEILVATDVVFKTSRGSGPGGQHKNKTDSAVTATHMPTGVTVFEQGSRSQWQNKQTALRELAIRIGEMRSESLRSSMAAVKAETFNRSRDWLWVHWRDTVTAPNGKKTSMKRALKGRFGDLG